MSGSDFVNRRAADDCRAASAQFGVLVYRDANITDEDLVAFSRLLCGLVALLAKDGKSATMMCGRYIDRLERRDGAWKLAVRRATVELAFSADASLSSPSSSGTSGSSKARATGATCRTNARSLSRRPPRGGDRTAARSLACGTARSCTT